MRWKEATKWDAQRLKGSGKASLKGVDIWRRTCTYCSTHPSGLGNRKLKSVSVRHCLEARAFSGSAPGTDIWRRTCSHCSTHPSGL
eukprot:1156215-Pelagomonas_calceolata.AAC.13